MATYKVIQDIEAEDKFVGPLTLKQFIFAASGVLSSYLGFFSIVKGAWFLLFLFVPIAMLGFFLAFPWSKDQPTEVWVLAKLRFRIKPKKRIWNQDGIQELVTITVPKKIERFLTNDLSQTEVKSRLKTLADTIDSRGWAVKNAGLNAEPAMAAEQYGDRLISPAILPQQVPDLAGSDLSDPMDDHDSPVAATFSKMINDSKATIKAGAIQSMEQARKGGSEAVNSAPKNFAPLAQSYNLDPLANGTLAGGTEEKLISEQLKKSSTKGADSVGHMRGISSKTPVEAPSSKLQAPSSKQAQASIRSHPSPDIINPLKDDNLYLDTISRQFKRDEPDDNEVVISLH